MTQAFQWKLVLEFILNWLPFFLLGGMLLFKFVLMPFYKIFIFGYIGVIHYRVFQKKGFRPEDRIGLIKKIAFIIFLPIKYPVEFFTEFWKGRSENTEYQNGEERLIDRMWRGPDRKPSWGKVEEWRNRWKDAELVKDVLKILFECENSKELKARLENITHFPKREEAWIDLRGFDVSSQIKKRGDRIEVSKESRNGEPLNLSNCCFDGALLTDLDFRNCNFYRVSFRKATLRNVDFSNSDLTKANFDDADLRDVSLKQTKLGYVTFSHDSWLTQGTIFREISFKESSTIDPYLEKCGNEQNYFYIVKHRATFFGKLGWKFWYWSSNYGRSFLLWLFWTIFTVSLFGWIYSFSEPFEKEQILTERKRDSATITSVVKREGSIENELLSVPVERNEYWPPKLNFSYPGHKMFGYYYFSIVVFATLGFGDVYPINTGAQMIVFLEVLLGYIMLGIMVNVFSNYLKPN